MSQEQPVEPTTPPVEQPAAPLQEWLRRARWGATSLASVLVIGGVVLGVQVSRLLPGFPGLLCSVGGLLALAAFPVGLISGLVGTSADQNKLPARIGLVLHLLIIAGIVILVLGPVWAVLTDPRLQAAE